MSTQNTQIAKMSTYALVGAIAARLGSQSAHPYAIFQWIGNHPEQAAKAETIEEITGLCADAIRETIEETNGRISAYRADLANVQAAGPCAWYDDAGTYRDLIAANLDRLTGLYNALGEKPVDPADLAKAKRQAKAY